MLLLYAKWKMDEDVNMAKHLLLLNRDNHHDESMHLLGILIEADEPCRAYLYYKHSHGSDSRLHEPRCLYYGIGVDKNEQLGQSKKKRWTFNNELRYN